MTLTQESRAVDLQLRWLTLSLESAALQYELAMSKISDDDIVTESENYDIFLMESEEAAQKSKNAILTAIEKVIQFIKNVASKIAAAFSKKKVQSGIDNIKDAASKDPKINNLQVNVPDYKQHEKDIAEYKKAISTARQHIEKTGELTDQDRAEMSKAKAKCSAKVPLIAVGAVSGAIAVGAILNSASKRTDELREDLKKLYTDYSVKAADINDRINDLRNDLHRNKNDTAATNAVDEKRRSAEDIRKAQNKIYLDKEELELNTTMAKKELLYGNIFKMIVTAVNDFKYHKGETGRGNAVDSVISTVQGAIEDGKQIKKRREYVDYLKKQMKTSDK